MPRLRIEIETEADGRVGITEDLREASGVDIQRGRPNEAAQVDPGTCTLTLNNRHGRYSPDNPLSPYFRRIGPGTPLYVAVEGPEAYIRAGLDTATSGAQVASSPALDITADLDIRIECALDRIPTQDETFVPDVQELAGRYDITGDQRSWLLFVNASGVPNLRWSPDGVAIPTLAATANLPARPEERFALRATLDVDNGSGGHTVTFYTAPSLAGPWRLLGEPVTGAGTTSVFNAVTPLQATGSVIGVGFEAGAGRYCAFELRDGIGGPVIASYDAADLTPGQTGWSDDQGNTWTLTGEHEITRWYPRFRGAVEDWPQEWDTSGADSWTAVTARGVLARLGTGQKPLTSALARRIPSYGPVAYWPMEEDRGATQAYSPIAGVPPMIVSGLSFAADDTLPGSRPLPAVTDGATLSGLVPGHAATELHVEWMIRLSQAPATHRTVMRVRGTGTVRDWWFQIAVGSVRVFGLDIGGATVLDHTLIVGSDLYDGRWVRWQLTAVQSGGNVAWQIAWRHVGAGGGSYSNSVAGTLGRVSGVQSPPGWSADLAGMALGHVGVFPQREFDAFERADDGWRGESSLARIRRLSRDERQTLTTVVSPTDTPALGAPVGPQPTDTFLNVVRDATAVDGGLLYELRATTGLHYIPRALLYGREPAVILDYGAGEVAPPLRPTRDTAGVRNDITVTRPAGSSARAVLEAGRLSVQQPPAGLGPVDESVQLNAWRDQDLTGLAWWRLHLRTWDQARYPDVHINLANPRGADLRQEVLDGLDVGAGMRIINTPGGQAPGPWDLDVQGYSEHIDLVRWDLWINGAPLGPWLVGQVAQPGPADDVAPVRVDTEGTELSADATATATQILMQPTAGQPWTTSAGAVVTDDGGDFPLDADVGGERITLSGIEPHSWDDFERLESDGWGTTPSATVPTPTWFLSGGTAAERSVAGGQGIVSVGSTSVPRFQFLPQWALVDSEVLVAISPQALATGASLLAGITLRITGSTYYLLRAVFQTSGAVGLEAVHTTSTLTGVVATGMTYTAASRWWLRARLEGQRLRGRIWPDGRTEPSRWQIDHEVVSSLLTSGVVGVLAERAAGNTNSPALFTFDAWETVWPQTALVSARSVNGIVKTHSFGTAVQLADPAFTSL